MLVQYRGIPFDWRKRVATLGLNTTIPWTIEIVGGVNRVEADLRDIEVRRFELTGGSERLQLEFGRPRGDVSVKIVGGAKTIRLERPAGIPVQVKVVGGSGALTMDGEGLRRQGGVAKTEGRGWANAKDRYALEVVGGSKSIDIVERAG